MGSKGSGRPRKYRVKLSVQERETIQSMKRKKAFSFQAKIRLGVILAADENVWKRIYTRFGNSVDFPG